MEVRKRGGKPKFLPNNFFGVNFDSFLGKFGSTKPTTIIFASQNFARFSTFSRKSGRTKMVTDLRDYSTFSKVFTDYDRRTRVQQNICDVTGVAS